MKIAALYNTMVDVDKLAELSVEELRQMVRQYPYFQTVRKLLLRKLSEEDEAAFDQELKQSSVYIGDRAKLYFYLHTNKPYSLMTGDSALPDLGLITTDKMPLREDNVSMSVGQGNEHAFNYLFLSEDEVKAINSDEQNTEQVRVEEQGDVDLIDRFMSTGGQKIKPVKDSKEPIVNLAEESVKENPAILTETLARIYIKQKKYDRAIDIFNNLSLKFPEKSAYFADRIRELDILIKSS